MLICVDRKVDPGACAAGSQDLFQKKKLQQAIAIGLQHNRCDRTLHQDPSPVGPLAFAIRGAAVIVLPQTQLSPTQLFIGRHLLRTRTHELNQFWTELVDPTWSS